MRLIDIDPIIERLKNAIYLGKRIGEDTANMEAVLADVEAAPTYNDDLISRQAALEKGVGVSVSVSDYEQSEGGGLRGSMLLNVAERAANARPCGIWIEEEDADWAGGGYWRCSACGFGYSYGMLEIEELNYCPHCGARMEGATWKDR